ncbi:hypothetical protein ScalyP_jg114, partial [Parmales sp. scaly parma]
GGGRSQGYEEEEEEEEEEDLYLLLISVAKKIVTHGGGGDNGDNGDNGEGNDSDNDDPHPPPWDHHAQSPCLAGNSLSSSSSSSWAPISPSHLVSFVSLCLSFVRPLGRRLRGGSGTTPLGRSRSSSPGHHHHHHHPCEAVPAAALDLVLAVCQSAEGDLLRDFCRGGGLDALLGY